MRLHTLGPGSVCPRVGLLAGEIISCLHEEPAQDSAAPGHRSLSSEQKSESNRMEGQPEMPSVPRWESLDLHV